MTRINSQILWGTSYLNVLKLGRPIYNVVTGREAREGSEWAETTAGVRDSWIVGRDYVQDFEIRWVPDGGDGATYTPWSGPLGVQAFLDWARDSNTFRFVPDDTYPSAYIDGCYLADPFRGAGGLDQLIRRTMQMRIIHPTVDFQTMLRGLLFEYLPGQSLTDPTTFTLARADAATCAPYRDSTGRIQVAAADVLRDSHYVSGVRYTVIEGLRKNKLTVASDGVTGWSATGTPVVVAAAITFGDLSLVHVTDDDGAAQEYHSKEFAGGALFTADGKKSFAVVLYPPDAGAASGYSFQIRDTSASADRLLIVGTWTGTTPSDPAMTTGTFLTKEVIGYYNGLPLWALYFQTTAATAANNHTVYAVPAVAPSEQGDMYYGGMMIEDALFPSLIRIKTTVAVVQREADVFTVPITWLPQDITILVEMARPLHADLSGTLADAYGILGLNSATGAFALYFNDTSRQVVAQFNSGSTVSATRSIPVGVSLAVAMQLTTPASTSSNGKVALDVNDGSGFTAFSSAASAELRAWASGTLRIGSIAGGTDRYLYGLIKRIRIAYGLRTLAQMQAL